MKLVPDLPNTENVHYIDEYPHLQKRVWLRRLAAERAGQLIQMNDLIIFPDRKPEELA